jgi:hypothetical protein
MCRYIRSRRASTTPPRSATARPHSREPIFPTLAQLEEYHSISLGKLVQQGYTVRPATFGIMATLEL